MYFHVVLILHIIGASIWAGGHIILLLVFLPKALKEKNFKIIETFEIRFEKIGIPSLISQIVTGVILAYHYNVNFLTWFSFSTPIEKVVSIKLLLLILTLILAIHAKFFIIPKLNNSNLFNLGIHITLITLTAVSMLIIGTFIRFGGL
ncbi:MAG: copper resistance protein CopD [Chlorobiota bacterium]|nr:MAG: copper resistance protein CopD [Chlorobiota bacterium]